MAWVVVMHWPVARCTRHDQAFRSLAKVLRAAIHLSTGEIHAASRRAPVSLLDSARGARARDVSPSRELCRISSNRKVRALSSRRSTTERIERGGSAQPFPINISAGSSRYCSMLHRKNRDSQSDTRTTVRSPQAPPRTPFSSVLDVKNPVGALLMRGKLRAYGPVRPLGSRQLRNSLGVSWINQECGDNAEKSCKHQPKTR
ncbi:hypothetical protein ABIB00_007155 [Bradyrhizobium sp. LB14.3]